MSEHVPGYEVTRDGRVFSVAHNWRGYGKRELVQDLNSDGYSCVRLTIAGTRKRYRVHTLVASKYLPPKPSPNHEIRHLDGDKLNNSASNLMWGTRKENAEDRELHGRTSKGISHSIAVKSGLPSVSPNKGKVLSDEHRKKLSVAMRGKPWSEARRRAQSVR